MKRLASIKRKNKNRNRTTFTNVAPTKLSVLVQGAWTFATLETPTIQNSEQEYFYMPYRYGVVATNQNDPIKTFARWNAGGYVARNSQGNLSIVSAESFRRQFPPKRLDPPMVPYTSANLTDPLFLTKVVRKERAKDSNTIQIGNRTFESTTPNRTIVIQSSGEQTSPPPTLVDNPDYP